MIDSSAVTTFLFSDIEGSSALWEREPERMKAALAGHDVAARSVVASSGGTIVKMTGDGLHAAFADPAAAVVAALRLQQALSDAQATAAVTLRVRCGVHAGVAERRDGDYFGGAVNRAARLMAAAHGGQVLVSQAVVALAGERLPPGAALRDLGTIRLRDLATPERVFQLLHAGLRSDFPPLRSLEATPNNLPQQVTSFIGREAQVRTVVGLLRRSRLLTLVGTGGLGKTRLSLQVAAEAMDEHPDGVWFVELASLRDDALVAEAVAAVLGVKEDAGRPVIEALVKYVRDRRLLIVLDNCEHLVDGCARLAKSLLQASATLSILASSREDLRVAGETTYPVPVLSVPGGDVDATSLHRSEAVRLFVERAMAVQPSFALTGRNAKAVASICRRLDGIPLAIELAAARVRSLAVDAIAERLNDRFALLTSGDRTVMPRHRTLRALIDWSYDLLADDERVLLRRLSVFAGGFTLDAAETVAADDALARTQVVDVLTRLVEKSLVTLAPDADRYALLETVREYAQEKLVAAGEIDSTRGRHLRCFVELAEQARSKLFGDEQVTWLARLDVELDNVLAAHAWCDDDVGGAQLGLRLAYAVKHYWLNRGLLGLGHRLTDKALRRAPARSIARCRGLADAGQLSYFMGRYDEARGYLDESLEIARDLRDMPMVAAVLQPLGMVCVGQGDVSKARERLVEAVALAEQLGNRREIAGAVNALAQLHRMTGDPDAAQPLYERVLAIAREQGNREIVWIALLNLAMVEVARGSLQRANALLLDAYAIAEEIGSRAAGQCLLDVCAGLGVTRGEMEDGVRFFGAAEAQAEQTGLRRDPSDEAFVAPLMDRARKAVGSARFISMTIEGRAWSYEHAMTVARTWLDRRADGAPA